MSDINMFKTKITTSSGTFEFEGSQEFVEKQIDKIVNIEKLLPEQNQIGKIDKSKNGFSIKKSQGNANSRKSSVKQPTMIPNLVTDKNQIDSLKNIYELKKPNTHIDTFAVMTYWLKTEISLPDVSVDEMWTLYKILQIRPPKVLIQVFRDGKSKMAYFESAKNAGRYYLTTVGETFVEHDLPQTSQKSN